MYWSRKALAPLKNDNPCSVTVLNRVTKVDSRDRSRVGLDASECMSTGVPLDEPLDAPLDPLVGICAGLELRV